MPGAPASHGTLRQVLQRLESGRVTLVSQVALDPAFLDGVRSGLSVAAGRDILLEARVDPRFAAGAALFLGPDIRVDLDPRLRLLQDLQEATGGWSAEEAPTLEEAARRLSGFIEAKRAKPLLEGITGQG